MSQITDVQQQAFIEGRILREEILWAECLLGKTLLFKNLTTLVNKPFHQVTIAQVQEAFSNCYASAAAFLLQRTKMDKEDIAIKLMVTTVTLRNYCTPDYKIKNVDMMLNRIQELEKVIQYQIGLKASALAKRVTHITLKNTRRKDAVAEFNKLV